MNTIHPRSVLNEIVAVDSGKRSPITGKQIFEIRDPSGAVLERIHVASTAIEAVQIVRDRPLRQAEAMEAAAVAARAAEALAAVASASSSPAAPRSPWKLFRGRTDSMAEPDEFLYHVTSYPAARQILRSGLVPNASQMFGEAYRGHSRGRVFLADSNGVNFWRARVEDQLHANFDEPPPVAVVRIRRSLVMAAFVVQDDPAGSTDARARSYFVEGTVGVVKVDETPRPSDARTHRR